ncbi:dihydrolipoyl dehydrogenase [Povalibacter sp.]|uniref:dihydrolipoyl dehydrogenase n=1 Tax=Povalibacter sp. TaxID=1962978 RepID=UPI002F40BB30
MPQDVIVPDLGDFKEVEVIEVLVKPGDQIDVETPLITLETEKATMDVPSSSAGVVKSVAVKKGDRVSRGSVVVTIEAAAAVPGKGESEPAAPAPASTPEPTAKAEAAIPAAKAAATDKSNYDFDVVVLGAGPGGYTAAFRAADLGMKVAMIERWPTLGGVCLNVGCIPSKALLHAAKVIDEAEEMQVGGITFGKPQIDLAKLREWKSKIVGRLTGGLAMMSKQRKVEIIRGTGSFVSSHEISVSEEVASSSAQQPAKEARRVSFAHCIIAAGSESIRLPGMPEDPRIIDSTGALEIDVPQRLLVVGGGIIGLEMATVYAALGAKVSVVELTDGLIPGCDRDLVRPLEKRIAKRYEQILVKTKVTKIEAQKDGIKVTFEGEKAPGPQLYDKVLVAVGRSPNGRRISAEAAGVTVNDRGFIPVDKQMRTNVSHIFAIGDIVGQPMLAHKASHEAKVAAEVAFGEKRAFDARVIPSVAYTDPEIAWAGLTETDAKASGVEYGKASFPWAANARSLTLGRDEGLTKLLFDKQTHRLLGGGIVGPNAGDLIAEVALAIEMGSDAADIGLTIHPHPTLSETIGMSAEAFEGTLTDLYLPKKKG